MNKNAIQLIDCILVQPGLNLTQMVQQSRIPQTTVHRTLNNLCREKLLIKQKECYFPGPILLRWINSNTLGRSGRYVQIIHPFLVDLAQTTGETVHLVQRDGYYAYYIDKVDGSGPISLKSRIGHKLQLYSTAAGRALLTIFKPEELTDYWKKIDTIAMTPKTQIDKKILQQELKIFQQQGYAYELEQDQLSIHCMGCAINLDYVQLAISITSTILLESEKFLKFSDNLQKTAAAITSALRF